MIKISTRSTDAIKDDGEFKLLELDDELVHALEGDGQLHFKGDRDEDAVLCTTNTTYLLKNRIHSNSLTLLQGETKDATHDIMHTFHEILEAYKTPPNLDKIDRVLSHRVLLDASNSSSSDDDSLKYDFDRLASEVQASDDEIRRALSARRIVNFGGELRPVDPQCLLNTLDLILNTLNMVDMSLANFDKDGLVGAIHKEHSIDKTYLSTVLSWYTTSDTSIDAIPFAAEMGLCLLKAQTRPRPYEAFVEDWKSKAGYELSQVCTLDILKGAYLMEAGNIFYFTTASLSKVPATRFQELFKMRTKWFAADLLPFIKDLGDNKEIERMIMKFCRSQTDKSTGMETYTSRQRV